MSEYPAEKQTVNLSAHYERLMKVKQLQIDSLLDISQAINNNFPTSALLRIYEFTLKAQFSVPKLLVFVKDEEWEHVCSSGISSKANDINVEEDLLQFERLTELKDNEDEKLREFDVVIPVYHQDKPLAFALIGDLQNETNGTYEEQLKFIQTITSVVTVAVENRRLLASQIEQEILKKEMALAAEMQTALFPQSLPNNENVEMAAIYLPHHDIGGDYYDYIQLSETEIAFCIGDISGKGVAAALLMANFQASLRILIESYNDLKVFAQTLNERVSQITKGEKFITFFLGIYNLKSRELKYFNAGHNPSLLFFNGEFTELTQGCTVLGMFEDLPSIKSGSVKIEKDAVLINYTDGITDFENEKGEFYGMDRFVSFIKKNHAFSMELFNQNLLKEIQAFKGAGGILQDDITLLSCRFP